MSTENKFKTVDELVEYYRVRGIRRDHSDKGLIQFIVHRTTPLLTKILTMQTNVPSKWDLMIINEILQPRWQWRHRKDFPPILKLYADRNIKEINYDS